jgi:uncharacterized protein (TIRG00374 family)
VDYRVTPSPKETVVNKRQVLNVGKYLLAAGLLAWVVRANWSPPPDKAVAALGASTVGLNGGPMGPLVAASAALPDRTESRGLGYVWKRHVVQGQPIHLGFLLAGLACATIATAITVFRWYLLVRALDLPLRLRDAFRYGCLGIFFNTFLPGSVGGDIVKAAALARGQRRRTAAVATVVMDRAIALWALVWFVALSGAIFWLCGLIAGPSAAIASFIVACSLLVVAVSLALWFVVGFLPDRRAEKFAGRLTKLPLVGHTAAEFWRAVWMYRRRQKSVALVMLLSWVGHAGFVLAFDCSARVLWGPEMGSLPSLLQHFLLVPLGLVMQALVPTPGGAGGGEWGFGALYLLFHAAEANGVLGSLVQRLLGWVLGLGCYVVYLCLKPRLQTESDEDTNGETPKPPSLPLPAPRGSALAG